MNLLPITAVAKRVGLQRTKLYELMKEGAFPAPVRIGRTIRFIDSEITEYIEQLAAARSAPKVEPQLLSTSEIARAIGKSESYIEKDRRLPVPRLPFTRDAQGRALYDLEQVKAALGRSA